MQDRFEDLRTFVAVVQGRSFASAARQLGVVKSAVSRRVNELEERLGVHLLNRSTRNLSLTDTGRVFFEKSTALLAALEEVEGLASHGAVEPVGDLRILAPSSFGRLHLVPMVCRFLEQHPRLSVELSLNDEVVDLMTEGFDMAVRIGKLPDSNLSARSLGPIRRVACASPEYIARFGAPKQPSDLSHHSGILYSNVDEQKYWRFVDPRTGDEQSVTVTSRLRMNTGDSLCDAALAGAGIAVLPTFIIHEFVSSGKLVPVMLPFEKVPAELNVVFPCRKLLPAKVKAFADFLGTTFISPPYWDRDIFGSSEA
ncbi:LysR family transcriptional regulator [Paucibacter sp. M5-1]|uniref:LysR family transcriptional regulator n=1 Tax=Paucibacter sp. M5-1 TaxID=3015998 RepID=UPI003F7E4623